MIDVNFNKYRIHFLSYLLIILCFSAIAFFSATQTQIDYAGGIPYDAHYYYQMATQVASNENIVSNKPFSYRVALPYLVGIFFPNNIIFGFKCLNFIFSLLLSVVLFFLYRCYSISKVCSYFLILLFILNPLSYFRFTFFYPCFTDPAALFFILLIFLINKINISIVEKTIYISCLSFGGVFFREIVLIAPIIVFQVAVFNYYKTNYKIIILSIIPIIFGVCGILITHFLVTPLKVDGYGFISHALAVIDLNIKSPEILLLSVFTSFGPIILLIFYTLSNPKIKLLFSRNKEIFIYILYVLLLSFFSGVHTDRIMFWAFPILLIIIGYIIDNNLLLFSTWKYKVSFFVPLLISQLISFRVFTQIPNANFDALKNSGKPEYIIFGPYGNNTSFGQVYSSFMEPQTRWVLLLQFFFLSLYLFFILFLTRKDIK